MGDTHFNGFETENTNVNYSKYPLMGIINGNM